MSPANGRLYPRGEDLGLGCVAAKTAVAHRFSSQSFIKSCFSPTIEGWTVSSCLVLMTMEIKTNLKHTFC